MRLVPRAVLLRLDHAHLLAMAFLAGLAPALFALLLGGVPGSPQSILKTLAQLQPRTLPVCRLRALALASHLDPGRAVAQPNGRRRLVDLLAAGAATSDESFLDVRLAGTDSSEASGYVS